MIVYTYEGGDIEMIEQNVQANSLSCLLNADSSVELIPEPFRMQSNVLFRVTYSEYSNYILSLQNDSGIILMSNIDYLRSLASTDNPKLYSCFLKDLAFAICKELHYAERYRKDASVILPTAYNHNDLLLSMCLSNYSNCRDVEGELKYCLQTAGFELTKVKRIKNIRLFQLAVILYAMSKAPTVAKEVNLVYDLTD